MRTVALYQMLFGLVTLIGGIIGFATADSTISLIAGGVAGIALIGIGLRIQKGWRPGLYVSIVIALALIGHFGRNFFLNDAEFMPAGLMSVLAIISIILTVLILVQPKERKRDF